MVTVTELVKAGLRVDNRSICLRNLSFSHCSKLHYCNAGYFLAVTDSHRKAYEGTSVVMLILVFVSFIIFNCYYILYKAN